MPLSPPTKIPLIWANAASSPYINPIPTPSQQTIRNGAASFTDGFPPLCFVPIASGGAGPFGADFNGILQQATAGLQWLQAGGAVTYDAAFQTAIGGYPLGAIVQSATTVGLLWLNTVANNTTNPDAGGTGWVSANRAPSLPGTVLNTAAVVSPASNSVTISADAVVVATALGGQTFVISPFSQSLNISTTGLGGMDTGAPPVSGFVSIYVIYDPVTRTSALMGTVASQSIIYGGSFLPAGYTASALIAIWPTDSSGLLIAGGLIDRWFYYANPTPSGLLNAGTATTLTAISLSSLVPSVARLVSYTAASVETSTITGTSAIYLALESAAISYPVIAVASNINLTSYQWCILPVITLGTIYYLVGSSSVQGHLNCNGYQI